MGLEVLIVEDQVLIAIHLQDLVEEAGHRVSEVAHDGPSAMAAAARQPPNIAIMDLRLAHGESGIDVAHQLYEEHGIRCLFISANIDDEVRKKVAGLRPLGFIGKPFLPAEVIAAVQASAIAVESNAC
ncbi:response regulator [Peristeroidobacter soli]|jgi:DNA-binding response OmpR family regulator|uniref:response regulator n=1 Tax=Peristeroidobacter soli TaxID=2497877 RepID=UPI00101D45F6|nr:response regulator [Peristeroidobacter soli]